MKCQWIDKQTNDSCNMESIGKSKYCIQHKAIAFRLWKENIEKTNKERQEKYAEFNLIFQQAHTAAMSAASMHIPTPMTVVEHVNPIDDNSPIKKIYEPVMEGLCGFAWIHISPGNCSLAKWAVKNWKDTNPSSYYGGVDIWIDKFGQSYERKLKYAQTFADYVNKNMKPEYLTGVSIYGAGRLD